MSSWVSHLPPERRRKAVIGHGMNEAELKQNGALDDYFLRNLNEEPRGWPVDSNSVDAVVCCVRWVHTQGPLQPALPCAAVLLGNLGLQNIQDEAAGWAILTLSCSL